MLTRLVLTNFRSLASFDADLSGVTALLGPNSSGKTTVLHAIRFACELLNFALKSEARCRVVSRDGVEWIEVADGVLVPDITEFFSLVDWESLFVDQRVGEGISAKVVLFFEESRPLQVLEVELTCARNRQLKLSAWVKSKGALEGVRGLPRKSARINQSLTEEVLRYAPRAVFVPPFYGTVPNEEYRARVVIDRLLGTGDQSHVVRNLVSGLDINRFSMLNAFLGDTLGARLVYRTSGDALQSENPLRVTFVDTNGEVELSAAGAGLINLVALYATLARWGQEASQRQVIFLLDEPEAHLAPRLQAESAARLGVLVTDEFGAQLIMATHSVDILNRLSQEGATLIRCDRSTTPSATVLPGDSALFTDLSSWVDLTPYTAINFLASRRILFCEGKTEEDLLPILGALKFRSRPDLLSKFRLWAIVPLHGSGHVKLPALLGRLLKSDAVRGALPETPFQVEVVLDRDYERSPGWREGADGEANMRVWSRHSLESLFLEQEVLMQWIIASLPANQAPVELYGWINDALVAANQREELNRPAIQQMIVEKTRPLDGAMINSDRDREFKKMMDESEEIVKKEPQVWQRGKDRANFVLREIKNRLPPGLGGQLPTSVDKLLKRADKNRIGDLMKAIPNEVHELLEALVGLQDKVRGG